MTTKTALKLTVYAILIIALGRCLRGHDILTGLSLVLALVLTLAQIIFAIIARRRGSGPSNGNHPPYTPIPIPPVRPRPPELSAAAKHG
jgi:hypothetical protein